VIVGEFKDTMKLTQNMVEALRAKRIAWSLQHSSVKQGLVRRGILRRIMKDSMIKGFGQYAEFKLTEFGEKVSAALQDDDRDFLVENGIILKEWHR
jgi:hypothetical protein